MAAIWTNDDPIFDADERSHNCTDPEEQDEILECESCGREAERLYEVADCDETVGYHSTVMICGSCLDRSTFVHTRRTR